MLRWGRGDFFRGVADRNGNEHWRQVLDCPLASGAAVAAARSISIAGRARRSERHLSPVRPSRFAHAGE